MGKKRLPYRLTSWELLEFAWGVAFYGHFEDRVFCKGCNYHGALKAFVPFTKGEQWYFGIRCPVCNRAQNVFGFIPVSEEDIIGSYDDPETDPPA